MLPRLTTNSAPAEPADRIDSHGDEYRRVSNSNRAGKGVEVTIVLSIIARNAGVGGRWSAGALETALGLVAQHCDKLSTIVRLGAYLLVRDNDRGSRQSGRLWRNSPPARSIISHRPASSNAPAVAGLLGVGFFLDTRSKGILS